MCVCVCVCVLSQRSRLLICQEFTVWSMFHPITAQYFPPKSKQSLLSINLTVQVHYLFSLSKKLSPVFVLTSDLSQSSIYPNIQPISVQYLISDPINVSQDFFLTFHQSHNLILIYHIPLILVKYFSSFLTNLSQVFVLISH